MFRLQLGLKCQRRCVRLSIPRKLCRGASLAMFEVANPSRVAPHLTFGALSCDVSAFAVFSFALLDFDWLPFLSWSVVLLVPNTGQRRSDQPSFVNTRHAVGFFFFFFLIIIFIGNNNNNIILIIIYLLINVI